MSGAVERLDHVAELVEDSERILPRTVGVMRREERDRLVAPVVHAAGRAVLRIELEDWQQLYGGDAEILEIRNLVDQAGIGPALVDGDPGARMPGEAADVKLVDDGLGDRAAERRDRLPSRNGRDRRRRSSSLTATLSPGRSRIAVVRVGNRDGEPVRIESSFSASNRSPRSGVERPVSAVGIDLARPEFRDKDVPVVIRAVDCTVQRDHCATASTPPALSKSSSSIRVACFENTLKLTPPEAPLRRAERCAPAANAGGNRRRDAVSPITRVVRRAARGDMPDVAAVVADRAIRGESAHSRAVENRHPRPVALISICLADALLTFDVALIVGQQHVVVARQQRLDQRAGIRRDRRSRRIRSRSGRSPRAALRSPRNSDVARSPAAFVCSTSAAVSPNRKKFSGPTASRISTLAPSSVPIVSAPFIANFMLPVPEASLPAVEICSEDPQRDTPADRC